MQTKRKVDVRKMALLAVFTAIAYAVTFVFRINVGFLTFDAKDSIVCITAMIFDPVSGIVVSMLVATIEQLTVGDTGFWGWLMDFASTATFSFVAGAIYRKHRKVVGVVISLVSAAIATVAIMILCNLLITPIYMKVELGQVIALIPTLLLPFNIAKVVLNAGLVLALYKPLINALRSAKLLPASAKQGTAQSFWSIRTLGFVLVAIILVLAAVLYMVFGLNGNIDLT